MALTVLVVDDHPAFRAYARRLLEASGFSVVGEAADAASALAAAGRLLPGLVLVDVQLPDEDGLWLATRLAAMVPTTPVVLTSSRDAGDYGRRLEACGARGFIPKAELSGESLSAMIGVA